MPRGRKTERDELAPRNGRKEEVEWGGFIDLRLNDEEKAEFTVWADSADNVVWTLLDDAMGDGCKYACSYDAENETYVASFTSETHGGRGFRCVLTSRASTWEKATALLCYKHHVLLETDWRRFKPRTGRAAEI